MISLTLLKELKPFDCAATALRPVQRRRKTGPAEPDVTRAITGLLAGLWSAAQPHAAQGSPPRPFSPPKGHPCVQSKQLCNIYRFLIDIAACAFTNGRPVRVAVAQRAAAESVLRGSTAAQGRDPDVQRSAIRSLPSPRLAPLGRPSKRARAICCKPSAGKVPTWQSLATLQSARDRTEGPLQNPSWICSFVEEPCFDYICFHISTGMHWGNLRRPHPVEI